MTRRRFIFVDQAGKRLYVSPEFNGCQEEYANRGSCMDSCDLTRQKLFKLFRVASLKTFKEACTEAQNHYHSFLGASGPESASALALEQLPEIKADEVIFIINGRLHTAPPYWDGTMDALCTQLNSVGTVANALAGLSKTQPAIRVEYRRAIQIPSNQYSVISGFLHAVTESEMQGEDDIISCTAVFPNRLEMDIKCCGSREGPSWTEAVLFDHESEVACTEVCEEFLGTWELEYDGVVYIADVSVEGTSVGPSVHQEGMCPFCGGEIMYTDSHDTLDDGYVIPWRCPSCNATGKEGYTSVFDQHYDLHTSEQPQYE